MHLFLFLVGLDIQQKFTVFYLGPRRCVNQTVMQGRLGTDISHPKPSNRAAAAVYNEGKQHYSFLLSMTSAWPGGVLPQDHPLNCWSLGLRI